MTIDLLPLGDYTHDAPTAVLRLDIALRGLPHDTGSLGAHLFIAGVRGLPHQLRLHPIEVMLTACVGADVEVSGVTIEITHDDWRFQMRCPSWLADFYRDCIEGGHPLIEGQPCVGTVRPIDPFATAVTQ